MTEEDYLDLIRLMREEFLQSSPPELADFDNYMIEHSEGRRLPTPRDLFVEMVRAFGRHLDIRDRSTYDDALTRIRDVVLNGSIIEGATVIIDPEVARATDVINPRISLSQRPRLGELGSALRNLETVE